MTQDNANNFDNANNTNNANNFNNANDADKWCWWIMLMNDADEWCLSKAGASWPVGLVIAVIIALGKCYCLDDSNYNS